MANEEFVLEPKSTTRLSNLCGPLNCHLRELERHFEVRINNRGCYFSVVGNSEKSQIAACILKHLYGKAEKQLTMADIHIDLQQHHVQELVRRNGKDNHSVGGDDPVIRTQCRVIKPCGENQRQYVRNIDAFDLTFGVGPAGTGKTYLAVAKAIEALEKQMVEKLILVRPAVEAGERLGFLPGDLIQKTDPYLRPIYDALHTMVKIERMQYLIEQGIIEVAPLAYMRGRSLNDAFIILDEAQNTSKEQMKMLLTRIGSCSKAAVTGDLTQVDLPYNQISGLGHAVKLLRGIDGIGFSSFDAGDVIRHPLLQKIIAAYDKDARSRAHD